MIGRVGPALGLDGQCIVIAGSSAPIVDLDARLGCRHGHAHAACACEGDHVAQVLLGHGGAEVVVEDVFAAADPGPFPQVHARASDLCDLARGAGVGIGG